MLLCAGLGTRLRPLTDERPKPVVPVLGRPLASFAMHWLAQAGMRSIVANTHHLPEQILPTLGPYAQKLQLAFDTVHEPTLLGTGGGIRNALPRLGDGDFIVFNGDVLAAPDLVGALRLHREHGAKMTMVLREDARASALGAIEVDATGRVVRMLDEGPAPTVPVRRCLFTGVYVLSTSIADDLPEEGCVVRHTLRRLLARGERVAGLVDDGVWFDLGTIGTYAAANFGLLDGSIRYPGVEVPFEARWIDPLARIDPRNKLGSHLVVGARANIGGEGLLERAIVWDGAETQGPLRAAVVTREGRVVTLPSA